MNKGKFIVISGPSGVGKGTICNKLINELNAWYSVSTTTRSPREGEKNKVNYYFISERKFKSRIKKNDFLEYNVYGTGKYYGTPKSTVLKYMKKGYDVLLEIDINGYKQIKSNFKDAIGIFIMPPDIDELYNRLRERNTEDEEVIKVRVETAKKEISEKDIYDHIIVNENGKVEEAAKKIFNIINS